MMCVSSNGPVCAILDNLQFTKETFRLESNCYADNLWPETGTETVQELEIQENRRLSTEMIQRNCI